MADFLMPKLGADMTAGTLVEWRKKPGDTVQRGDIIAEVETDKGVIEIEGFIGGVLDRLLVEPGTKVPVGTLLATIREGGVAAASPPQAPQPETEKPVLRPERETPAAIAHDIGRLRISPSARLLARKLGVDAGRIKGTGPGGAITREDIERAAASVQAKITPATAPPSERSERMRQSIAAAMSRSKRDIPHYYLSTTIDMHPALTWLTVENEKRPITERLLYGVLLLKAAALALHEVPELNAVWDGERVVPNENIHVGVAISLRHGGLIAPAIHHTDKLSLSELMTRFRDLVNRTRGGGLRGSEILDATITVTSLGEQGVESVFPIIYPPQVAIVGFGKVVERPWVVDGQVVARRVVTATLAGDHRVSDGHRGGIFLTAMERLLQEPDKL